MRKGARGKVDSRGSHHERIAFIAECWPVLVGFDLQSHWCFVPTLVVVAFAFLASRADFFDGYRADFGAWPVREIFGEL